MDTAVLMRRYQAFGGEFIHGDAFEVLPALDAEIADLVFLDPPYNLQLRTTRINRWSGREVRGLDEEWDRFDSFEQYDAFIERLLRECQRLMKPSATLWIIGSYHCIFRIGKIMQDLGFWILNDVIWFKSNAMPNFRNVRFTNATETLIWAVKDKSAKGYTFHPDIAHQYSGGKLAINVWRLPICQGDERSEHRTQKPEALLERIIRICTNPGDLVLDPMAGSGTTGVVAQRLGRRFLLIEKDERYVSIISRRLENNQIALF